MKKMEIRSYGRLLALVLLSTISSPPATGFAQGTAFTYQGRLNNNGAVANGTYNLTFALYDVNTGGTAVTTMVTNSGVIVTNGLFTVTMDFGPAVWNGQTNWLQLGVATNGVTTFTALTPRQQLTPVPYAIMAGSASNLLGALAASQLSGTVSAAQLPANVVTKNEAGVTLSDLTVSGTLSLPTPATIDFYDTTLLLADANGNFFAGENAGVLLSGVYDNTGIGAHVLNNDNPDANYNTAVGAYALYGNTSGSDNTAIGLYALAGNTNGNQNVAVGNETLSANSSGTGNTGLGGNVLAGNTTGYNNVAVGYEAIDLVNGLDNVAIGVASFQNLTNGTQNTAAGTYSFQNLINGSLNIGLGYSAGKNLTGGTNNIYIGNSGGQLENGIIRIGTQGTQTATYLIGNVGINNTAPSQPLEVNGNYALIDGGGAGNGDGLIDAYIGGSGGGSDVQVGSMNSKITAVGFWNTASSSYMHIYCSSITIEGGSDLAEPFKITADSDKIPQGAVVVIDEEHPGRLKLSDLAYDPHVAGVISGANGIHPGIQMQQQGLLDGGKNVALTGRVYVQADAVNGAIKPGDLLTTSAAPGYAMKVTDHVRAQGAILGKAMTALQTGRGMVLVLVTLQ